MLPNKFDVVFSMGVSYHQRDLKQHLLDLYETLNPSGTLILESLIADQDLIPQARYANMRNVWLIPSIGTIQRISDQLRFETCNLVDVSITRVDEQRQTQLSPGHSLQDSLNRADLTLTVEGYPAPKRGMFIMEK